MDDFCVLINYRAAIRHIRALHEAPVEAAVIDGAWRIAVALPKGMQPSGHERMILAAAGREAEAQMESLLPASAVGRRGFTLSDSIYRYVRFRLNPPGTRRNHRDPLVDEAASVGSAARLLPYIPGVLAAIPDDPQIDGSLWMVSDLSPWVLEGPTDAETAIGMEMAASSLTDLIKRVEDGRSLRPDDFYFTRNTVRRLSAIPDDIEIMRRIKHRTTPLLPSGRASPP